MFKAYRGFVGRTLPFSRFTSTAQAIDPLQEAALTEKCILVDENDRRIGSASKLDCHKVREDGSLPLHRAFSVFLFTTAGEIVLQRRSSNKVTFPDYVSNTCCSHPIEDFPEEMVEENARGIKSAARRRLNYELGIQMDEVKDEDLTFLTRILYKGIATDGIWGEHELDYILIMRKNLTLKPNPSEIAEVNIVGEDKFANYLKALKYPVTPWFNFIAQSELPLWWRNLHDLSRFQDHTNIKRFY